MQLQRIWAKTEPFQSVLTHGIVSGVAAQELFAKYIAQGLQVRICRCLHRDFDQTKGFIGYLVSLHDIGKISPYVQAKAPDTAQWLKAEGIWDDDWQRDGFRHERETELALKRIWEPVSGKLATRKYTEILKAHHQGKPSHPMPSLLTSKGLWQELQGQFETRMRSLFLSETDTIPVLDTANKQEDNAVRAILLGIVILADWISSGRYFADAEQQENLVAYTRTRIHEFLLESGLQQPPLAFGEEFCQVWPGIPKGQERELQRKAQSLFEDRSQRYSLVLMEAPMGEGKTEAGVYSAVQMSRQWGKHGFYVALPTAATANQMVSRMRELLKTHDSSGRVHLLHGSAWWVESEWDAACASEDARFAQQWLQPLRRGMLAPFAVGTVDQVMMGAMFVKYGVLRLLGLAEKVLVIDEIHAYDAYMQNILTGLLQWCRALETPVVLLSATLPPEKKQQLLGIYTKETVWAPYPAITAVTETGMVRVLPIENVEKQQTFRIRLAPILDNVQKIALQAIEAISKGGCLCVLMNTVGQARQVYCTIQKAGFDGELRLFHSRYPVCQRQKLEEDCVRLFGRDKSHRPSKAILVATQVVEQSLDVDFDVFFSAVAPIDLLFQRMGRLFRHKDTPRAAGIQTGEFTVLVPARADFQTADRHVYPECLLKHTASLLQNRTQIQIPEDIQQLVADGYDSDRVPLEALENWLENKAAQALRGAAADRYKLGKPEKTFRPFREIVEYEDLEGQGYLSAQTRLSDPSVTIALVDSSLVHQLAGKMQKDRVPVLDSNLARDVSMHSVSLRKTDF